MRNYIKLGIGLLLMMGGCGFTKDYFSDDKKHDREIEIANVEKLIAAPTQATALFDSTYTETTIKIMGVRIKSYDIKYFFPVNGQLYSGQYTSLNNPPQSPSIEIKYLAEDPSINSSDPQEKLKSLKESQTSKVSLYIGLILLVIGGVNFFGGYSNMRKQKQEEERASEERIKAYNKERGIGLDK